MPEKKITRHGWEKKSKVYGNLVDGFGDLLWVWGDEEMCIVECAYMYEPSVSLPNPNAVLFSPIGKRWMLLLPHTEWKAMGILNRIVLPRRVEGCLCFNLVSKLLDPYAGVMACCRDTNKAVHCAMYIDFRDMRFTRAR